MAKNNNSANQNLVNISVTTQSATPFKTCVGNGAGGTTTGANNVAVGYNAGSAYVGTENNNICIGSTVNGTAAENNTIRIGTGAIKSVISGITGITPGNGDQNAVVIDSLGQLGTVFPLGTFTPTAIGQTVAGTTTYTTQVGYYIQIGKLVWVNAQVAWTTATGSGNLLVNVPFTSSSSASLINLGICNISGSSLNGGARTITLNVNNNATTATLQQAVNNSAPVFVAIQATVTLQYQVLYLRA